MYLTTETQLINLLGYAVGGALYLLLVTEALGKKTGISARSSDEKKTADSFRTKGLLIACGALGCVWNFGHFFPAFATDFSEGESYAVWNTVIITAPAFLPVVFVQIEAGNQTNNPLFTKFKYRIFGAYALSSASAALQFAALQSNFSLSPFLAFQVLAVGYFVLTLPIFFDSPASGNLRNGFSRVFALALFVVLLFHFGFLHNSGGFYPFEIIGHQASLPFTAAFLYRTFRFSFADLFHKRALSQLCTETIEKRGNTVCFGYDPHRLDNDRARLSAAG